jgi:hypothetical protein
MERKDGVIKILNDLKFKVNLNKCELYGSIQQIQIEDSTIVRKDHFKYLGHMIGRSELHVNKIYDIIEK